MSDTQIETGLEALGQRLFPGSTLLRNWPLRGGISAQMTAFELLLPDGKAVKLIRRQPGARSLAANPGAAADEFEILQILAGSGVKTPAPVLLDESKSIFPAPYLVIGYIDGSPEYAPADPTAYAREAAGQLAQIHSVTVTDEARSHLPDQRQRLARLLGSQPPSPDLSLDEPRIRAQLAGMWPWREPEPPVLLHGDFWPGNLLWRDGSLAAVIDWENAKMGDPVSDLAVSRLDMLMGFGIEAMAVFTERYQTLNPISLASLPCWDLAAALGPANQISEWAAIWSAFGRSDITEGTMRDCHRWFVERAFEALNQR